MNVIRGNVGKLIAEAFVNFIESDQEPLITFDDVLGRFKSQEPLCLWLNRLKVKVQLVYM